MANVKKIFVLDTNVILHNYNAIYTFDEHDIVLPITVLEEVDNFKKGTNEINFHAREFVRELDKIAGEALFDKGVNLGDKKGKLFIETGKPFSKELENSFGENTPDHRILAIAEFIRDKYPKRTVVLVSKDINLRMKAKSIGLLAEDYKTDQVSNVNDFYKETDTVIGLDKSIIDRLYSDFNGIDASEIKLDKKINGHTYLVLKNGTSSALAHYNPEDNKIHRVEKLSAYGIEPKNAEQAFALNALTNPKISLISLTGKAGTGKTLLALAAALYQRKQFKQILLARPIVALGGKDLGFLPGDVNDKIGPYMQPFSIIWE